MRWTPAAVLFLAGISAAIAQTDRATITGTVSDPDRAVVPGARVEARNVETGTVYPTTTTSTGNYVIPLLPGGSYQVMVSVQGFKKFVRSGLTVETAQVMRIDVLLEIGSASDSVTVDGNATLLRTESGAVSHNVSGSYLADLPILGIGPAAAGSFGIRNPYAIAQLLPGTYFAPNVNMVINGAPSHRLLPD